jgi:hypothetical protein
MIDGNSTNKPKTFLGSITGLFGLNKLKRFFCFMSSKLCPPQTIVINKITVGSQLPKEDIDKMFRQLIRSIEDASRGSA